MKNSITTDRTRAETNSTARIKQAVSEGSREISAALSGKYTLLKLIAASEMTNLYLARDHRGEQADSSGGEQIVELKIMADDAARDPQQLELFYLESEAAAKLAHDNIIRSSEASCSGRIHFSVMEHRPGADTLRALLDMNAWLEPGVATGIAAQIAAALDYAHHNGVLHLNLRPESILLVPDGTVLVTDFGIEAQEQLAWAQAARTARQTAQYLSAEQAGGEALDHRSDLYALGIIMFEMLTDRVPFDSSDRDSIKRKHVAQAALAPRIFCTGVPETLSAIVMGLLEKNPNNRIQSGEALLSLFNNLPGKHRIFGRADGRAAARSADSATRNSRPLHIETPPEAKPIESTPTTVEAEQPVRNSPDELAAESLIEIHNPLDLALDDAAIDQLREETEVELLDVPAFQEPDIRETEIHESDVREPEIHETEIRETEIRETDIRETESHIPEDHALESHVLETQAPESQALESHAPETYAPEDHASVSRSPEKRIPENHIPEKHTPEKPTVEKHEHVLPAPSRSKREQYEPPVIAVIDPPIHRLHESTAALEPLTGRLEPAVMEMPAPSFRSRPATRLYALLLLIALAVTAGIIVLARNGKLSNIFRRSTPGPRAVVNPAPSQEAPKPAPEPAPAEVQPPPDAKQPQDDAAPAAEPSVPAVNNSNQSTARRKAKRSRSYRSQPAVRARAKRAAARIQPRSSASNSASRPRRVKRRP